MCIDEFICLRKKEFSFRCNDRSTTKLEDISELQVKNNRFVEFYGRSIGGTYKEEFDNCMIRSKKTKYVFSGST